LDYHGAGVYWEGGMCEDFGEILEGKADAGFGGDFEVCSVSGVYGIELNLFVQSSWQIQRKMEVI
jgi:hypothetical protein